MRDILPATYIKRQVDTTLDRENRSKRIEDATKSVDCTIPAAAAAAFGSSSHPSPARCPPLGGTLQPKPTQAKPTQAEAEGGAGRQPRHQKSDKGRSIRKGERKIESSGGGGANTPHTANGQQRRRRPTEQKRVASKKRRRTNNHPQKSATREKQKNKQNKRWTSPWVVSFICLTACTGGPLTRNGKTKTWV